jgi:hypothetical protein
MMHREKIRVVLGLNAGEEICRKNDEAKEGYIS